MTTKTPLSEIISLSDLPWQERQPGVRAKSIWEHPETKRRAMLTRLEPGVQLPLHRHVGDELLFVIEGAVSDESGTVTAGNVGYRPDGCVHTVTSKNGATVLAVLTGGVEPATARGAAPGSQIVTVSDLPWIETRPGVRQKKIWEDTANPRRALLARFEPGASSRPPSPRGRRADLHARGRERGRIGGRDDRQHELPAQRLRAHGDDEERRDRAGHRLGPHGAGLTRSLERP